MPNVDWDEYLAFFAEITGKIWISGKNIRKGLRRLQLRELAALEAVYAKADGNGRLRYGQSIKANWHINIYVLTSIEQISVMSAIFVILGITGAFDTNVERLLIPLTVYWIGVLLISTISVCSSLLITGPLHHKFGVSYIVIIPLHAAVSALMTVCFVFLIWPKISDVPSWPFLKSWFQATIVSVVGICFLFFVHYRNFSFQKFLKNAARNALENHLPLEKRGRIMAISAQDHYVNITTEKNSHLLRMSFADAVSLMPECDGLQIHRSHWVERKSLVKLEEDGIKINVVLTNGLKIPVAKSHAEPVRALLSDPDH